MGKPYASELQKIKSTFSWASSEEICEISRFVEASYECPLVTVGSGGSLTVAYFASLLHEMTGSISKTVTPLEVLTTDIALDNTCVFLATAGGRNPDIISSFKHIAESEPKDFLAICLRPKSKLSDLAKKYEYVKFIEYSLPSGKDGYLATNSQIAFFTLLSRAYEQALEIKPNQTGSISFDMDYSDELRQYNLLLERESFVVLYGRWGLPAAIDLESKFTEAALGHILLADYRNFAHGRHLWLEKYPEKTGIIALITAEEERIAHRTLNLMPENILTLQLTSTHSGHVGGMELLVKVLYLIKVVGDLRNVDPGKPFVPSFGRKLYRLNVKPQLSKQSDIVNISRDEFIALRRKFGFNSIYDRKLLDRRVAGLRLYMNKIENATFGSVIFDYDGTLCDPEERYSDMKPELATELIRLLNCGIIIGIATGRGQSVGESLRRLISEDLWHNVLIGYYNGSDIGTLADSNRPNRDKPLAESLARIQPVFESDVQLKSVATVEYRPNQITIEPIKPILRNITKRIIFDLVKKPQIHGIQILESGHSFDLIAPNVSKTLLIDACKEASIRVNGNDLSLCIGDRGEWPGNDYFLLSGSYSLGVDGLSPNISSCWNVSNAGHKGTQATLDYLQRLNASNGNLKLKRSEI